MTDAVVDLGDLGGAGDGELVYPGPCRMLPVFAVDDEGVAGSEQGHGFGDEGDEARGVDAHDLSGGAGGLASGPRILKTVRTPRARRTGMTAFMAG